MQRRNKSAHAPKGATFFLFLGLAILPISLRAAGLEVTFSPTPSAAIAAWRQISDIFGATFQPSSGAVDAPAPSDSGLEPSNTSDTRPRFACAREAATSDDIEASPRIAVRSQKPSPRGRCNRVASQSSVIGLPVLPEIAVAAIKAELDRRAIPYQGLVSMKLGTGREELKGVQRRVFERSMRAVKDASSAQDLRVLVRMRVPTVPSATKAAECKVRAALDSSLRLERERAAIRNAASLAGPDNCEL